MRRPAYHKLLRPSPKVEKYLGGLESAVMDHLWDSGESSVREVAEALRGTPRRADVAYTTIMTVMGRLADKGLLTRRMDGRQYRYRPAVSREAFLQGVSRRVIDDLVADFGDVALAQFADALEGIDPERLRALRRLAGQEQAEGA